MVLGNVGFGDKKRVEKAQLTNPVVFLSIFCTFANYFQVLLKWRDNVNKEKNFIHSHRNVTLSGTY